MAGWKIEDEVSFWHRMPPPNDAVSDFSADLENLIEDFHRLPSGQMEEEPADFATALEHMSAEISPGSGGNSQVAGLCETLERVERGDLSAVDVVETCLEYMQANAGINAVLRVDAQAALVEAMRVDAQRHSASWRQPLTAMPLGHKDMFYRAGEPCTCGSLIRRDFKADRTASVLARLDAAGAIHLAALNMSEFAQGPTGHNRHFGPARNPWDLTRVTGGSSSGSGAAVAVGMVLASLGSDTGGSVRIPASVCGVTGLKPTASRVSRYGAMPLAPSMDCIGPLARSARDCARILSIIAGPDGLDGTASGRPVPAYEAALDGDIRGIRLGLPDRHFLDGVDQEIAALFEAALVELERQGAARRNSALTHMDPVAIYSAIASKVEVATVHAHWMRTRAQDYALHVNSRMYPGFLIPGVFYLEAMRRRGAVLRDFVDSGFADADLLVMPTLKSTPPTIAETDVDAGAENAVPRFLSLSANTRAFNYLGLPAITIPIGFDAKGMPAGLQLVGRPFSEALLLRVADAFQRRTEWHLQRPPSGRRHSA